MHLTVSSQSDLCRWRRSDHWEVRSRLKQLVLDRRETSLPPLRVNSRLAIRDYRGGHSDVSLHSVPSEKTRENDE